MQLSDIIREVSLDLNDQVPGREYTRWTVYQLQTYLREALIDVSGKLKDLFTEKVVVKVQPGATWQEACDCTDILRIIGEATSDGRVVRYLSRSADIEGNTWAGPVQRCLVSPNKYIMTGYTISGIDSNEFKITPPVPPGIIKYVLVECYKQPNVEDLESSVPDRIVATVKQWMLYRALSIDSENNPTIIQLANTHKDTYFTLLEAEIAQQILEKAEDGSNRIRTVQKSSAD